MAAVGNTLVHEPGTLKSSWIEPFTKIAAVAPVRTSASLMYEDMKGFEPYRKLGLGAHATQLPDTLFMLYAGGLKYILLAAILFAPGTVMYFIARREQGKPVFDRTSDWVIFGIIVAAAVYGVYGLATGVISI